MVWHALLLTIGISPSQMTASGSQGMNDFLGVTHVLKTGGT